MEDGKLFREAFNSEVIAYIADGLVRADPSIDSRLFIGMANEGLEDLSFGDRGENIYRALKAVLPSDFLRAAEILVNSLGPEPISDRLEGFDGFYTIPLSTYIYRHGLDYPDTSLGALYEITKRFSAEFAVRPFIEQHYGKTMKFLHVICEDPSPFARRLASEGTRPRLPLASRLKAFQQNPRPVIELLDRLFLDENLMVRRSVANNINDISKDNPDAAVEALSRWRKTGPGKETEWIIRHGLRSLVKSGHPEALSLLGYSPGGIDLVSSHCSAPAVELGGSLLFRWRIANAAPEKQKLLINYIIHFVKANGKRSKKIFRLAEKTIPAGGELTVEKLHKFRAFKNQRFYPGTHFVEISVNARYMGRLEFELQIG